MMLTCRYRADIISSVLPRRDLTWKVFCIATGEILCPAVSDLVLFHA
jgi:hypothetical protein